MIMRIIDMWNDYPLSSYTKEQIMQGQQQHYQEGYQQNNPTPQQNQPKTKQILNAVIVTGEYTDNQGMRKKNYLTIGTLFIYNDGGQSLKLDAYPSHGQTISFYPRKQKEQNQQNQNYNPNPQQNDYNRGQSYQGQ